MFEFPEALPENKRGSALQLQVRRWAPFANTKHAAHWVGQRASVYAWDGDLVAAAMTEAGDTPARCAAWPETFFRPAHDHGVRLVKAVDGVEGQAWRDGLLVATRWWPAEPSRIDWVLFLRTAGVPQDGQAVSVPAAAELPFLETPWTEATAPIANAWALLQIPKVAASIGVVLAAPVVYYLTQIAVLGAAKARVDAAREVLSASSQGVRNDRAAALADLDAVDAYLALETYPSQFEVLSRAVQLLREKNVSISEWTYDNGNLDMTVRSPASLDASTFIEMFEKTAPFSNASATTSDQARELRLKVQIRRAGAKAS